MLPLLNKEIDRLIENKMFEDLFAFSTKIRNFIQHKDFVVTLKWVSLLSKLYMKKERWNYKLGINVCDEVCTATFGLFGVRFISRDLIIKKEPVYGQTIKYRNQSEGRRDKNLLYLIDICRPNNIFWQTKPMDFLRDFSMMHQIDQ